MVLLLKFRPTPSGICNSVGLQQVFSSSLRMPFHQPLLVCDRVHPVAPTPFYEKGAHLSRIFISLSGTLEASLLSKLTVSYESLLSVL